jgi:hypothetical protein
LIDTYQNTVVLIYILNPTFSLLLRPQANEAGFDVVGWRAVPVNPAVLGRASLATVPVIEQAFFAPCTRLLTADGTFGGIGFGDDWAGLGGTKVGPFSNSTLREFPGTGKQAREARENRRREEAAPWSEIWRAA